jgi:hypothetical protein
VTLFDFLSLKNDVNVNVKKKKKKTGKVPNDHRNGISDMHGVPFFLSFRECAY